MPNNQNESGRPADSLGPSVAPTDDSEAFYMRQPVAVAGPVIEDLKTALALERMALKMANEDRDARDVLLRRALALFDTMPSFADNEHDPEWDADYTKFRDDAALGQQAGGPATTATEKPHE
jgi:hypothetical protein